MANQPLGICPSPSMSERLLINNTDRDRIFNKSAPSSSYNHHHHRHASASDVGSSRSIKPVTGSLKKSKSVASLYSFAPPPTRAAAVIHDGGFCDNRKVIRNGGGGGGCGFGKTKRIKGFWSKLLHLNCSKQVFVR